MKTQLNSLTATRAIAAMLVVVHHFGTKVFPFSYAQSFFSNGNLSVSYFFVLSGFVMYGAYNGGKTKYSTFMKKRIGRIVPMYLFALSLAIITSLCRYAFVKNNLLPSNFGKQVLFSSLLLQSFVPDYPLAINGPGWSLSIEMFFYILFPLLLVFQKKNFKAFISFAILIFIITQIIHLFYFYKLKTLSSGMQDVVLFNPLLHLNQFIIGMLGGYFFEKTTIPKEKIKFLPLVLLVAIIIVIAIRPDTLSYQTGLIAPLFMLFIVSMAICDPKIMNIKPLVFLGNVSFSIYILQSPVFVLAGIANKYLHLNPFYFFYSSFLALILASIACYYTIEIPMRNKINALSLKKQTD